MKMVVKMMTILMIMMMMLMMIITDASMYICTSHSQKGQARSLEGLLTFEPTCRPEENMDSRKQVRTTRIHIFLNTHYTEAFFPTLLKK